jgi:hypothetical protein
MTRCANPFEVCGSKGPRIANSGKPRCGLYVNHDGLHRGFEGSGFERETWGAPAMRDMEFVNEYGVGAHV